MKKKSSKLCALAVGISAMLTLAAVSPANAVVNVDDVSAVAAEPSGEDAYTLDVNGQVMTLDEGEVATFDLQSIQPKAAPGTVSPNVVYTGNGGTLSVWGSNGNYYWDIQAPCAVRFSGSFSITDLTSGLGGGTTPETGFSGSAPTSKLKGHRYSGTLTGTAYNVLGIPCAWTMPNNTLYTYRG